MEFNFSTRPAQSTQVKCPVKTFSPGCLKAGLTSLSSGLRIYFSSTFKTLYLPQISGPLLTCTVLENRPKDRLFTLLLTPEVFPQTIFSYILQPWDWVCRENEKKLWVDIRSEYEYVLFSFPFSRKDLLSWLFFGSLCFDWKILFIIFSEMGNSWTIKEIFAFARHIHEDTYRKASDFSVREVSVRRYTRGLGWRWSTQRVCVQGPTCSWEGRRGGGAEGGMTGLQL